MSVLRCLSSWGIRRHVWAAVTKSRTPLLSFKVSMKCRLLSESRDLFLAETALSVQAACDLLFWTFQTFLTFGAGIIFFNFSTLCI